MEQLLLTYRQYLKMPDLSPLKCVFKLIKSCPGTINMQQFVLKEKEDSISSLKTNSLLYITKIYIENFYYFDAINETKAKSAELVADKVIVFLTDCISQQDADRLYQMMMFQPAPWLYQDSFDNFQKPNDKFLENRSINFIEESFLNIPANTNNLIIVEKWSEFFNFYLESSLGCETELQIFNKMVILKKHLFEIKYELPTPLVKTFLCKIHLKYFTNCKFSAKSYFGCEDARKKVSIKIIIFLQKMINLIRDFKNSVEKNKSKPFKIVLNLINKHSDIIKMVKSGSNLNQTIPKFSTKIEIINVVEIEEFGKNSGNEAADKMATFLQLLAVNVLEKNSDTNEKDLKCKKTDENITLNKNSLLFDTIEIIENNLDQNNKAKTMNGIKKKLENVKESTFKQKLVRVYNSAVTSKKYPLEILKHLRNNGINLEIKQTSTKNGFETTVKFRDFPNSNFPEFSDVARKKIDSQKSTANKLVAYIKKLAVDYTDNNLLVQTNKSNDKNNFEKDTLQNEKDLSLKKLFENFQSLHILKQSQLEIIDMLKSKGDQIEIEHSFENDEHKTVIKVVEMEFSASDSKKAQSKRLAANKLIEFLKSSTKKQAINVFSAKEKVLSESEDENDSEKEEESIIDLKTNFIQKGNLLENFENDVEPLWGQYKKENPFIVNQRKAVKPALKTQMLTNLKKQYFGDDFEGPTDDKIEKLIMLIKRFNSVHSKNKTKSQILQDLKASGQPMLIAQNVEKNEKQKLKFIMTIDICDIAKFEESSFYQRDTEFALSRTIRFLKNLSHLIKNFLYFYSKTKYPTAIIESLMIDNFEMLKLKENKQQSDGFTKVTIEATNIGIFTGIDQESKRAKEIAMTKVCYIIMKIAGIPHGVLKVSDYIAIKPLVNKPKRETEKENQTEKQLIKEKIDNAEQICNSEHDLSKSDNEHQNEALTYSEVFKKSLINIENKPFDDSNGLELNKLLNDQKSLENVAKLLFHFRKANILESNSFDSQTSILEYLKSQGIQINVSTKTLNDEFVTNIEIANVTSFSSKAKTLIKSKEESVCKMIQFLKKLLKLVDDHLKNQNKENLNDNLKNEKIDNEQIKSNCINLLLKLYNNVYKFSTNPTQILDALIAQTASLDEFNNLLQLNQMNLGKNHPCITTISLFGETIGYFQNFSASASNPEESKNQAAIKLVNFLTTELQNKLEQKLNLKKLIKDSSLLLESNISKQIYEAVKLQWSQLGSDNFSPKFKSLAAFVITSKLDKNFVKVVSIGTGNQSNSSKTALPYNGQIVLDCHAEVVARRAFLCFLYDQIGVLLDNPNNENLVLEIGTQGFRMKTYLQLHLYSNCSPCTEKCSKFNLLKPCADKLKIWNVLGVQGAILSLFLEPLYINSIVVSDLSNFDQLTDELYDKIDSNLLEAMLESVQLNAVYKINRHKIGYFKNLNDNDFNAVALDDSNVSFNWHSSTDLVEVLYGQLGTVINQQGHPSRLSKETFVQTYKQLVYKYPILLEMVKIANPKPTNDEFSLYYRGLKNKSTKHQIAKKILENTFLESTEFGDWIRAPIHVDLFIV